MLSSSFDNSSSRTFGNSSLVRVNERTCTTNEKRKIFVGRHIIVVANCIDSSYDGAKQNFLLFPFLQRGYRRRRTEYVVGRGRRVILIEKTNQFLFKTLSPLLLRLVQPVPIVSSLESNRRPTAISETVFLFFRPNDDSRE